jgi:HK97 family phage major capsid protein
MAGTNGMSHKEIELMSENRAATAASTTVAAGGYTIPEDFSGMLEKFMAYYGPFAGPTGPFYALNTNSGADMPYPVVDDTSNEGYLIAESGDITTSSVGVTFGVETLKAYAFTSGLIPVTRQILQDSGFDFATILAGLLAERLGRAKNKACTTGTGSSQPEGVTIGATQGKHTASATAFTQNELIDFVYSVNNAYKVGPSVGFMMNPALLGYIRKLDVSTSNYTQPLFQPALSADVPDRILGYQYWENSNMSSAMTTGQKIIMFGDWSKFIIRNVKSMEVLRSEERYLEFLQIAFLAWMRFDSRVINSSALKYLELT